MISPAHGAVGGGVKLAVVAALVTTMSSACTQDERLQPATRSLSMEVKFARCERVLAGPVCVLAGHRTIDLWVRTPPDAHVEILADSKPLAPPVGKRVDGGVTYRIEVRDGVSKLAVRAKRDDARTIWPLAIKSATTPRWLAEATNAFRLGQLASARNYLAAFQGHRSTADRAAEAGLLGRIALREENYAAAHRYLRQAMADSLDSKRLSDFVRDATALAFSLIRNVSQFAEARLVLQSIPPGLEDDADSQYLLHYTAGLLALDTGDLRTSLREFESAAAVAARLGTAVRQITAEQMIAMQLQRVGRTEDASRILARWRDSLDTLPPCDQGVLATNLGWNMLLAREAGDAAGDPVPYLERALAIYTTGCANRLKRVNNQINLALAHLHSGDTVRANDYLQQAATSLPEPPLMMALWAKEIEARIALESGRTEAALALFAELDSMAAATLSPGAQWRAAVGKALALQQAGNVEAALAAFAAAEAQVDNDSLTVPINAGLEQFIARRQNTSRRYLELLIDTGRNDDALTLARQLRSRMLRTLDRGGGISRLSYEQRNKLDARIALYQSRRQQLRREAQNDWLLPADEQQQLVARRKEQRQELARLLDDVFAGMGGGHGTEELLPPAEPGELALLFHPLTEGWAAFAATSDSLETRRLHCVQPALANDELADCLLAPFAGKIRDAQLIRMMPVGLLRSYDLHALPFDGSALIQSRPVVYALDLGGHTGPTPQRSQRALVVADAHGDLPSARAEASAVQSLLSAQAWTVESLQGTNATAPAVSTRLGGVELFHFAGHAEFSGQKGWDSGLPLAGESRLTLGDILALDHAPPLVVLSGCETGRAAAGAVESIGLAQAFLISGSSAVLAAVRPVEDKLANEMVVRFYGEWAVRPNLAQAVQQAQLAVRDIDAGADWTSFRLIAR